MSDVRKDNFKRIAENRTTKIMNLIESLGNLTNKSFYDYTEDQVEKMFNAIQTELNRQHEKFKNKKSDKKRIEL